MHHVSSPYIQSYKRPFKTIQRALIEAARFSYQSGENNDRIDRTTILVYPGTHYIDNRYIDCNIVQIHLMDTSKLKGRQFICIAFIFVKLSRRSWFLISFRDLMLV